MTTQYSSVGENHKAKVALVGSATIPLSFVLLLFLFSISQPRGSVEYGGVFVYAGAYLVSCLALLWLPFRMAIRKPVAEYHIAVSAVVTTLLFACLALNIWIMRIARWWWGRWSDKPTLDAYLVFSVAGCVWLLWTCYLCARTHWGDIKSLVRLQCWWFFGSNLILLIVVITGYVIGYMSHTMRRIDGFLFVPVICLNVPIMLMSLSPLVLLRFGDQPTSPTSPYPLAGT